MRDYIFKSERIGFSTWNEADIDLALTLWCDAQVTKLIGGPFDAAQIKSRLQSEIANYNEHNLQYFPAFKIEDDKFIGCVGLRPSYYTGKMMIEAGIHLVPQAHSKGYGFEGLKRVVEYSKEQGIEELCAGHHPQNYASEGLLKKVGFKKAGTVFYEPTELMHPYYTMKL